MKVWELMKELAEYPAGCEVFITVENTDEKAKLRASVDTISMVQPDGETVHLMTTAHLHDTGEEATTI